MEIQFYMNNHNANIYSVVFFVILLSMLNTPRKCDSSVTEPSCVSNNQWQCLSNLQNQSSCPEGTIFQEKMAVGGCCPGCVKFLTVNETCEDPDGYFETSVFQFIEKDEIYVSKKCAPGLSCQMDEVTYEFSCQPVDGECFSYYYQEDAIRKPSCNADGTYSAVQCKGDFVSGRCFCNNEKGKRMFGESWWADSEDMTCECSKEVNSILALGIRSDVSLHCTPNGNYETLQCDDELCWCADYKTGLPLYNIVPEKMMNLLPCYPVDDSFQYLRECESAAVATGRIKDILLKHGTKFSNMDSDKCDSDGSYGNFQVEENQVRCTWKDRSLIQGFATQISEINKVTCNCARDSIIFKLSGKNQRLECEGNGNYAKKQFSKDKAFCVDSDGYPTTGFIDLVECPE